MVTIRGIAVETVKRKWLVDVLNGYMYTRPEHNGVDPE